MSTITLGSCAPETLMSHAALYGLAREGLMGRDAAVLRALERPVGAALAVRQDRGAHALGLQRRQCRVRIWKCIELEIGLEQRQLLVPDELGVDRGDALTGEVGGEVLTMPEKGAWKFRAPDGTLAEIVVRGAFKAAAS